MNKKLIIMIIVFGGLFLLFSSGIIYERVDDKNILDDENTQNEVNNKIEKLSIEDPEVISLYKEIDLGKSLIEKVYYEKGKQAADMGNDVRLLIASFNISKDSLIKGTPVNNNGIIERTYLINESVIEDAYKNIFNLPYSATSFTAHPNLLGLSFKYDDQTKMYYCDNNCKSETLENGKVYYTKLTEAQKQNNNIILYQSVVYVTNNKDEKIVNNLNEEKIGVLKNNENFTFTNDILKKSSKFKIIFTKDKNKYYLNSIEEG